MPISPSSRPPHAPANPPVHDPWVRNYDLVEYDVPLLHPKARSESGDDDEDTSTKEHKQGIDRGAMPSNTDLAQPPRTPPKNILRSPTGGNAGTDPRLSVPPRAYTHGRGSSTSSPVTTPQQVSKSQVNSSPSQNRQTGTGAIGSTTGGYVAEIVSQPSSSSLPPTTATATQGGAAQRSPRSSSFRSSPLAASTSSSSGMAKNSHYFPTSASTSTTGLISPSSGSAPFPHSSSTSTTPATVLNTSPPMSTPNSTVPPSSSYSPSSFFQPGQGQGQGARTAQRQRTFSEANSSLSGSSSSAPAPIPTNVPHPNPNSYQQPHPPNSATGPPQQPFTRQGSRGGPGVPSTSNAPNGLPNAAYAHRGPSEEGRGFESGQASPHAYSHAGFMGGGGAGTGIGLRDPGNNHSHLQSSASRGSMILYRLSATEDGMLPPPGMPGGVGRRGSMYSNSGDSIASLGGDSKYPLVGLPYAGSGTRTPGTPGRPGTPGTPSAPGSIGNRGGELSLAEIGKVHGGLVAYVYDPGEDLDADELDEEEEEWVRNVGGHVGFGSVNGKGDVKSLGSMGKGSLAKGKSNRSTMSKIPPMPNGKGGVMHSRVPTTTPTPPTKSTGIPVRGLVNVGTLVLLIIGLLLLFLLYPVYSAYNNNGVEQLIIGNTRINSTGQAVALELGAATGDNDKRETREWTWNGFDRDIQ